MPKHRYTEKQLLSAIVRSRGLIFLAAQNLGCNPSTLHLRAKTSEKIRAAIDYERGKILDFAEAKLLEAVGHGDAWAICFTLKTQGRIRGYVERQEIVQRLPDEKVMGDMSDAELAATVKEATALLFKLKNQTA